MQSHPPQLSGPHLNHPLQQWEVLPSHGITVGGGPGDSQVKLITPHGTSVGGKAA